MASEVNKVVNGINMVVRVDEVAWYRMDIAELMDLEAKQM